MGLVDRIKKVTGTNNDNYDDTYDDDYYSNFDNGYDQPEDDGDMQGNLNNNMGGMNGMDGMGSAPMNNGNGFSLSGQDIRVKIVRPKNFGSGSPIARYLLNKCTVVLNLEDTNRETARRLIDFLSGVAFSIDGTIKKAANNVYVITPSNVDVGDSTMSDNNKRTKEEPKDTGDNGNQGSDFEDFD